MLGGAPLQLPSGETTIPVIPSLTWPEDGPGVDFELTLYGALLDHGLGHLWGEPGIGTCECRY